MILRMAHSDFGCPKCYWPHQQHLHHRHRPFHVITRPHGATGRQLLFYDRMASNEKSMRKNSMEFTLTDPAELNYYPRVIATHMRLSLIL